MNKERRSAIRDLAVKLDELRGRIQELKDNAETLQAEEQDYFDNMPESFQNGERGSKAQEAADYLQAAIDALEEIDSQFDEAVNALSSAEE